MRTVSTSIAPSIRPGDLVVSTQPETVPALHRYLPAGVVYLTPMGLVSDPRQTDWRDGLRRLRSGQAETRAAAGDRRACRAARRVLIVTPVPGERLSQSPWARAVRIRTREWRAALDASPRLQPIGGVTTLARQEHRARPGLRSAILAHADVQVVVVVDQRDHHVLRALEVQLRADEDLDRARRDEPVDELLGELAVHL